LFLAALPVQAADQPKASALTPKEVADGWILLFDGETTFGWTINGEAKVSNGKLLLGSDKTAVATPTIDEVGALEELRLEGEGKGCLLLPHQKGQWRLGAGSDDRWVYNLKIKPDTFTGFGPGPNNISSTREDGTVVTEAILSHSALHPFKLRLEAPEGHCFTVKRLKVKPAGLKPIFNGKDLTGWKEFPGKKSKFSVSPEGWLNLKDGPGDLQTTGQWGDFILQLDCRSNGDRLNSGVFFRCRPGEYQQGYEAQIHNGFTAEPQKEYTLEEYDPKTHQLTGKKKVKYTAQDYGTGAIYRRMPARRQVARDYEWFTMTVLAHGRHMAVWVNGIQVTDWTDNRPPSDNARNGCRLEKGPISLQGHDKTTDLSFRNIRIAELPPAAPQKP
jgi:hypothetical protein